MTVLQNPTFAQMTAALEHATTDGSSDFTASDLDGIFHDDADGVDAHYYITGVTPSLEEMSHFLEINEALAHFGIKGMKWGIRRSDRELAALKNEEGERVGGVHVQTRKEATQLKRMKAGQAVVIESEDGPRAVVKLKDGSFKQVHISADAQSAVRTMNKEQVEMSTRELKEAAARAKAIEDYNKYFGPKDEGANKELQAAVERLELETKYATAYAKLNPTKIEKVANFVSKASPIYDTYAKLDKAAGGQMTTNVTQLARMIGGTASVKNVGGKHRGPSRAATAASEKAKLKKEKAKGAKKGDGS